MSRTPDDVQSVTSYTTAATAATSSISAMSAVSRRPRLSFLSTIDEHTWTQMDDLLEDPLTGEDEFEKRYHVFQSIMRLHWITSLVYSIVINACIIVATSLFIIEAVPTDSDAWNGLIGGVVGLAAGIILGYVAQQLAHGVTIRAMNLEERCRDVGIALNRDRRI